MHHIKACQEAGILPISGVEAYFRPDRLKAKAEGNQTAWHLCLFAKNLKGWHSLLKIVSQAYGEVEDGGGFYKYPCVDWELLERYSDGLICSTACVSSWLSNLVDLGHDSEVRSYIQKMQKIFGDDLWIEIMPHDFDQQRTLNIELVSIAKDYGVPLIATNDAHFPYKEWADTHRIAKMMGSSKSFEGVKKDQEKGKADYLADLNPTLYLCTADDMKGWFWSNHPDLDKHAVREAMDNTWKFVQTIKPFMLNKSLKLPKVTESVAHSEKILEDWIEEGLTKQIRLWRFVDRVPADEIQDRIVKYRERIAYEWKILKDKGVFDYFVMVGEVVRWCASDEPLPSVPDGERDLFPDHRVPRYRKKPIRVGLGRGSAAGCLVSYLVGIVQIDPIAYTLLFERFLNPNRKGLPDIDLDFQSDMRPLVKEFVSRRYGRSHVADIITHQRFQPKKVLADLARTFDIPQIEGRRLTTPIEIRQDSEETTLEEIYPLYEHLQTFKKDHPMGEEIWKHALRLEGSVANAGKHAAGVIITPKPIVEYMALERGKSGDLVTSWSDASDFSIISDYGFVKLDALGIKGLQVHDYACELVRKRTGKIIDLYSLRALRDPHAADDAVMAGFREGRTIGVFQFGSSGITKLLKAIKPDNILDIAAANALYRPGPLKASMPGSDTPAAWDFPKRKNNKFLRSYIHPDIKEWLSETYGIVAYQEQVMQIAGGIGRLSAGDTDDMRKAMGKLYRIKGGTAAKDFMRKYEVPFFDGAMEDHGWSHEEAESVWNLFLEFGHYGFNKSHSCSYALQAYQDMWLKTYYPHEFYAAFLTYEEDEQKIRSVVREARAYGIELRPPDINDSDEGYSTDGEVLTLGLTSISGMGSKGAKATIRQRPFESPQDFFQAKGIPHRQLIESGACDQLFDRALMLSIIHKGKRDGSVEEWQVWEHLKHNVSLKKPREIPEARKEPSRDQLLAVRNSSFTVPIQESALSDEAVQFIRENCHLEDEFAQLVKGDDVICGGEITKVEFKKTKTGKDFCNIKIAFETSEWRCKLWTESVIAFRDLLVEGKEVMAQGTKDVWNDFESVVIENMVTTDDFFAPDDEDKPEE